MARVRVRAWRSVAALGAAVLGLSASGCASAWARGVVLDPEGKPVEGATVELVAAEVSAAPRIVKSQSNGCFSVLAPLKKGQQSFRLTVRASGRKDASTSFPAPERLTAAVTLVADAQPGASSVTGLAAADVVKGYEERCVPAGVPGATSLGLR